MEFKKITQFRIPESFKNDIEKALNIFKSLGCTEIYLFGSIIQGDYREYSDIDFAVKSCPKNKFYYAIGKMLSELEHDIDVIDIDQNTDFFDLLAKENKIVRIA